MDQYPSLLMADQHENLAVACYRRRRHLVGDVVDAARRADATLRLEAALALGQHLRSQRQH